MAMAKSSIGDCDSLNLIDITKIKGLTTDEALTIVENDDWLDTAEHIPRFVTFDGNTTEITSVKKANSKVDDTYCKADFTVNRKTIKAQLLNGKITGGILAAVLFSINGNIGPFNQMKTFVENGGNIYGSEEEMKLQKMFLAHVAWYNGNQGYGAETDPLCIEEKKMMNPFVVPETSSGNKIFSSDLFRIFSEIVNNSSINTGQLKINLGMDLNRANLYLTAIYKQMPSGGNRKLRNKKYNRKSHKKSKKTKKHKKNGNRKSRKH